MSNFEITVVMAIYKPNLDWLKEDLVSIQEQTYRNFQIFAWNDCPDDKMDYDAFFKEYLLDIPFSVFHGTENLGSNGAFENLTKKVDTPYIAYCDQDDIWMPDKLEKLHALFITPDVTLAYSDMKVINEKSEVVAQHIAEVRPRQIFYEKEEALIHLLAKNFVTGCTMMMQTDIAKQAVPFPKSVFHDWWLAVCAAINGNIVMASEPLMKYRIYSGNQSAVLKGVDSKQSYFENKIEPQYRFIQNAIDIFGKDERIVIVKSWMDVRVAYFRNPSLTNLKKMITLFKLNSSIALFEIVLPFFPNFLFKFIIKMIKSGNL